MSWKPPMFVIDGSYYLHRTFHAVPPMRNSKGVPTNAVFGVINAIHKVIEQYNPEYVAVVFDAPDPTFRHKLSPLYKAHRPEYPEELTVQIKIIHEVLDAVGIPLMYYPGFEGDDVIGTLATFGMENGERVIISTGDKDMTQLVQPSIMIEDHFTGKRMNREAVYVKFNVYPEQMADYLALVGDRADGITGVIGCGGKTAAGLLGQFKTIDNMLENIDNIKGIMQVKLRDSLESLAIDRQLAKIVTDLDLGITMDDLRLKPAKIEELRAIYRELNFSHYRFAI